MSSSRRTLLVYWAPILAYVGLIFLLSSFSRLPFKANLFSHMDKLLHFTEYSLLALLVARGVRSLPKPEALWSMWLLSAGIVLVLGGLDELFQSLVPNRQSDLFDLMADCAGGLTGSGLYLWWASWRDRRVRKT
jgi:VanZ family protein